jgi:extracellular matrix protein 14
LAAASRVLLLDVWAITAEYVDIRLTDSMVSHV